jgi:hypothetical protein
VQVCFVGDDDSGPNDLNDLDLECESPHQCKKSLTVALEAFAIRFCFSMPFLEERR